jgi:hypothetical protein
MAMTKASAARIARRRGRPPRDHADDLAVAELAIALQAAWGLPERKAIDLTLAICEGTPEFFSKIPRGTKTRAAKTRMHGGSLSLPGRQSFHSRSRDIRRKLEAGRLRPDAQIVLEIARLLHLIRRRA